MKKNVLLLFVLMLLPVVASAFEGYAVIDGIRYHIITKGKAAEVVQLENGKYSGDITIPSTVEYDGVVCNVTSIGEKAFYGCTGLTSVTIPNSVTSIGGYAFWYCTGLTSITIPNSVTSIGDCAFYGCTGLTSVTIPNSVTRIGWYAFYGCSSLTAITIPNSVTSIGDGSFFDCSGLTSVTIPNSVTSIGIEAFWGCTGLTSVTIPNSVTNIGNFAFSGCTGLTSITIPNSVTRIGRRAFQQCTGLTSVTIGNSVTSIGGAAFVNCSELADVYCYAEKVPSTQSDAFQGSYIEYATLHVPDASLEDYKNTAPWSGFGKIVPLESSDVEAIDANGAAISNYFSLDGQRIEQPRKGVNIVRMSDGTVKKVVFK